MFDFGNANDGQRQAISTTEGPVLITAGPGTGKTYTLVQRAIYLIEERGVKPEDIFIATFTEKAAKELITRITNELASRNITVNVNEMYVGTFHSLCLRIIKEHLEYTRLKKNYRLLDTFDQQYLVFRNIYKFRMLSGIENVMPKGGAWKWAQAICEFSNNLTEEVVDIDAMLGDHDMEISVIAKVVNTYQAMLDEENLIDFSAIQTECYRLLTENKDILEDLRNSIKYIMVDEYQDTNYIQEQIIFLLGTDYTYSGLLYRLFMYKPFSDILDTDIGVGVVDIRPARNLAKLTQIIGKFEYLHNVDVLTGKYIIKDTELLFNMYIKLLFDGGIAEYEDDEEYAPTGCVSFLTIHQSKGMEFPIVFVDSLGNVPRKSYKDILNKIEGRYYHRETFEPYDEMKLFDFWRLYYTAFSRAQDLLVLTCNEDKKTPSKYIKEVYGELQSVEALDLSEFTFHTVKSVNLKNTFSFTSHIAVYETCALQYKFYKELEFMPIRQGAMLFGTLVHETIEDVHRAALRHETEKITKDNITSWFDSNYISLIKTEHGYLAEAQRKVALNQVLRYVERQHGNWSAIQQAEVDVSLVQPDYIIEGKIDLVKGENGTVELVDFKSEKKPDMEKMRERLEHYRRQLHIYAYLIEQRTGQKVSKMHLYYTGEENGNPMISFPYTKSAIDGTVAAFDDTVHKILKKDFRSCSNDPRTCSNCDFRYYCQK